MLLRWQAKRLLGLAWISFGFMGCGGRSGIPTGDGSGPLVPCKTSADCFDGDLCTTRTCQAGYCTIISRVSCDDGDICTADSCDPASGQCVFQARVADADGDGYIGVLPGTTPGAEGSCGDDCDDSLASVHPGASEICDGLDNNCNGTIDEGVNVYSPLTSPIRISDTSFPLGSYYGLAFNGSRFAISWTGQRSDKSYQGYISSYDTLGLNPIPANNISQTSNNSFAGPLVWTGSVFATAWEVRADKGYDVYFNELDVNGKKLGPDIRLSANRGFSIQPSILWNGDGYWIVWSDDNGADLFQIYGRRVDTNGQLGEVTTLSSLVTDARSPQIVRGQAATLLVYLSASSQRLLGQLISDDLKTNGPPFYISDMGANDFSVAWVNDRFVVTWDTQLKDIGSAIWAATADTQGNIVEAARTITNGANFARTPSIVSLGDRFALAWSDDRLQYGHYGIRLQTFDASLNPLVAVTSLVELSFNCTEPGIVAGGSGLGLVFHERDASDITQPYFVPLACGGSLSF